jgi:hypothetical protein
MYVLYDFKELKEVTELFEDWLASIEWAAKKSAIANATAGRAGNPYSFYPEYPPYQEAMNEAGLDTLDWAGPGWYDKEGCPVQIVVYKP